MAKSQKTVFSRCPPQGWSKYYFYGTYRLEKILREWLGVGRHLVWAPLCKKRFRTREIAPKQRFSRGSVKKICPPVECRWDIFVEYPLKRYHVSIPYLFFIYKKSKRKFTISPSSVIRSSWNFTGILEKIFPFDFWCLLVFSNGQFSSRSILVLKINN